MKALLHNIRSVHNVGAIFRTADGAGFNEIVCIGITPTPLDRFKEVRPDFIKASLGAESYLQWEHRKETSLTDTLTYIENCKKENICVITLEQYSTAIPYTELSYTDIKKYSNIALLVGHETEGVPQEICKNSMFCIYIPMYGKKESLNVSSAFAIAAYHLAHIQNSPQ